ncbi:hypothetical protein GCM10010406_53270 [Streptomyces thermolineatus]|uniref:Uncharacterized protein n=1 Tax=Streptomyces thermolineatus TaxID=44033 RepID=A0ABP6AAL5_9ACTN
MSSEMYINPAELKKLGKIFESHSYDLRKYLSTFNGKVDAEAIHDGFGVLTESEEVTDVYIELAKEVSEAIDGLQRRLDSIGDAMRENAKNTEDADDALSDVFKVGDR